MNRFRSRKKSHDGGEGGPRSSSEDVPPIPSTRTRTFRRKKVEPEPKFELDLSTALPPSDNFRTSLLMPNLSARFSMLREQDDPTTKIGKANDDSVLFPKRASRLNLFGNDGLSDIAEVASLSHSIRPPFANDRTASYASTDGYGTDDDASQSGSVMSRAKPGQGNKFFGGRQKIYKIPLSGPAAAKDLDTENGSHTVRRGMGRAVYDDDVAVTEFQAMQEKEREEDITHTTPETDQYDERASTDRRESPPPYGYNENRETSSSTTSGPFYTRVSTAATSVASSIYGASHTNGSSPVHTTSTLKLSSLAAAVPERTIPKGKRMYGHAIDQQIHDQQSSAVSRLDSLQQRKGNAGILATKRLSLSRSASNLNDRFRGTGPLYASTNFRAGSPPSHEKASGLRGFDLSLGSEKGPLVDRVSPSMSPPLSPTLGSSVLVASLEPRDVGKATASGAFNKPKVQYNEQQYTQRQLQLQEGRDTPPLRSPSSADAYSERSGRLRNDSFASIQSSQLSKSYPSNTSDRLPGVGTDPVKSMSRPAPFDPYQNTNGTFLANLSGDDSSQGDSDPDRDASPEPQSLGYITPQARFELGEEVSKRSYILQESSTRSGNPGERAQTAGSANVTTAERYSTAEAASVATGIVGEAGLSGLVKTHLRNQSGTSSVYPDSPPPEPEDRPDLPENHMKYDFEGVSDNQVGKGNHKWTGMPNTPITPVLEYGDVSGQAPLSMRARQMLEQATQLKNSFPKTQPTLAVSSMGKAQRILGGEAPSPNPSSPVTPWQEQVKAHHMREGSSATQREREEFANELADRRRRVQENLQSFVESESRSSSPRPGRFNKDNSPSRNPGAIGLLKKASKGSLIGKNETSSKAMKMLGIGGPSGTSISPFQPEDDPYKRGVDQPSRAVLGKSLFSVQNTTPAQPDRVAAGSGQSFRDRSIGAERRDKLQARKISPPILQGGKTGPDALGDRVAYPNRYIDSHHVDNASYQPSGSPGYAQLPRKYSPPRRFDAVADRNIHPRSQSAMSNRSRSNSRGGPVGYFDGKVTIQPAYQNNYPAPIGRTPRVSPAAPYAANPTPPTQETSSMPTTPTIVTGSTFSTGSRPVASRKRSVNKHDISEPTFINCTSSVTTINLPQGASLSNGMHSPGGAKPPVPPINPRRKRTIAAQNVLTAFGGRSARNDESIQQVSREQQWQSGSNAAIVKHTMIEQYEEQSNFSADENEARPKGRYRLRKTSSEGGNLAARARHQALMADQSPAMPSTPVLASGPGGQMF